MNLSRERRGARRSLAVLAAGAVMTTGLLAAPMATAQDDPGAEAALTWSNYEKTTLTKDVGEPIDMAILPDSRVLHTARNGDIRLTDPSTGITRIVSTIPVYANSEDGLQGIAVDPDFEENQWVYLVYAPV